MDFLNKTLTQISDLFRSMTPAARITSGLLLTMVVVSLGYLFTHRVSDPDTDLMNGLQVSANELPAMEAAFAKAGLNAHEIRGTKILVPREQKAAYMAALAEAQALPAGFGTAMDEALKTASVFMSSKEREERLKIAKQKELAMIISSMKGIESASVLYDAETKPGFNKPKETTATVSAKSLGQLQLDDGQVVAIRHLVAGAIVGLNPANVTVLDLNGRVHHGGDVEGGGDVFNDPYGARKRVYEQEFKSKILNALSYVPGVTVVPNVELDRQRLQRTKSIKYDPKPTTIRETSEELTRTSEAGGPSGQPGYVSQQPNMPATLNAVAAKGPQQSEDESKRETVNVANSEQKEMETVGMTPQRVSVSIGIPSSYFEKVWLDRNPAVADQPPPTPDAKALATVRTEEVEKIREYVAALLPPAEGVTDPLSLVTVKEFQDIKSPQLPGPSMAQNTLVWFGEYWSTVGLIGLGLGSLWMLRSMVRGGPSPLEPQSNPHILPMRQAEEDQRPNATTAARNRLSRITGSGPSLRDELSELVKEDPDAAVNILRNWIGNAG